MGRSLWVSLLVLVTTAAAATPAQAAFPYLPGTDPSDYGQYRLEGSDPRPNELSSGAKQTWMYAADQEAGNPVNSDPRELNGVRGAHLIDATTPNDDLAWATTVGRPDVTISVLDSGIKWNDRGAMLDLRRKMRLTRAEVPMPNADRSTPLEDGADCSSYTSQDDANGDGVFNVVDFACDSRVERDPAQRGGLGVGPSDLLDPQDVLIAFSDGTDDDSNGFVDDIVGWDFLDNDNDPFDDVQYGHGTGEARDSSGEADNGGDIGSCPNCMVIPLRVGDSFIADSNRFAQATIYATDNGVDVVQEALGTLNNSSLSRAAVDYAYDHGVTVIASAADEAAQHHNWPSTLPHVIIVNSVTQYDIAITPATHSYLQFNGCTNFSSKITIAIPSVSCSSDATGRGSGMAGLIYSAALNAREQGALAHHPTCTRTDGSACVITPNEVRQIMASGRIDGAAQADDVNFAQQPEPSCTQAQVPTCTDPNLNAPYDSALVSPVATTKRYPTRRGHDQIFGYGRVNMNRAVDALVRTGDAAVPPEVEITAPDWYDQIDPGSAAFALRGQVYARGSGYSCDVYMAPGSQPNNDLDTASTPGDFKRVPSTWCNGDVHTSAFDGVLADVDVQELKALFPASAGNFDGREPGTGAQTSNGRPNTEPYGFTVKVIAHLEGDADLQGEDRRNMYLHRDQDMIPGFPRDIGGAHGDGESSPILVDLDGDNRNELVMGSSDGFVHAYRPEGSELPGWPVRGDRPPLHTGGRAFQTGAVSDDVGGPFLASVAAADMDRDGAPEVVGVDMEGKVYAWDDRGDLLFQRESNIDYSGKPLQPFEDVRYVRSNPDESKRRRTQHGFVGSPVLVDLDSNDGGRLEIVAASMDRHVYAWNDDGSPVPGFPVLVVDPSKVASVDPQTHAVTFNSNAGEALNQGSIVDTPAVGDLTGDGHPEIVVGTNEEYATNQGNEGPLNSATFDAQTVALLATVGGIPFPNNPAEGLAKTNGRVFAIHPEGTDHAGGPFLTGWPVKLAQLQPEVLPVVGEGVAGAPAIGPVECPNGGVGPKVGTGADAGPAYILNLSGQSCYGQEAGKDITLQTDFSASPQKYDTPAIPAFGHPIFAGLGPTVSFFTPAAGLVRALDIAINEYQGGQDFVAGWEAHTGQFRPGWPAPVNDLQFLTGPSAGNVDAAPGEEIVSGTASLDLAAFNQAGVAAGPGWPKLTSDWMVANPLIGSFGTNDLDSDARNRVVAVTRSGSVLAYRTDAPPCPLGSWPRYHHDNANSGDYRRDAVSPGKPIGVSVSGTTVNFTAPGDDLLCGTADHYEIATSNEPIDGDNFDQADSLADAPQPEVAGSEQSYELPAGTKAFVAIRAVDDQGNVGRPVVVTTGYPRPKGATPLRASLVPAYNECTAPNAQHGPPLAHPSCNPPAQESSTLTVGTIDANGFAANSVAYVRFSVHPGNASTPTIDEADVGLELSATDVRCAATNAVCPGGRGSDYEGRVLVSTVLRITDRDNDVAAGGGSDPATVADVPLEIPAGCTPTAGTETGATCAVTTTVDSVLPGAVKEGDRAIWQMGRIDLRDAGPNGAGYGSGCPSTCGDGDEATFMRQGVFIP
jgi:hypothetical protein